MSVDKYIKLITKFIDNAIDAKEFEQSFLEMFKTEQEKISEKDYLVLDSLFGDVDMFCFDSELFEEGDLTESDLRKSAEQTLERLINNKDKK
ncbi:colicin immunity domain-containing protein [Treponema pedis]|nr:colicin immunity domain-containing protein [Treponema pedis]QSI05310.1 hypothetical protein DYQ05_10495 [Treponema pedis]